MDKKKIIIDTDIGDDIDDLLAISMALSMPDKFEIIGITTVFGDTTLRGKMVKKLLSVYCREDIPVYAGYGVSMSGFSSQTAPCVKYFKDAVEECFVPNANPEDAVDFIIDACKKYQKDLTVVALGPMTNLYKVLLKDESALNGVDKVVAMAGAFYKQYADWNVFCDSVSAKAVFDSVDNLVAIGADVTHQLVVDKKTELAFLKRAKNLKGGEIIVKSLDAWRQGINNAYPESQPIVLHDPLAIYTAIDESFVEFEKVPVLVATNGLMNGFTFNQKAYSKIWANECYKDVELKETLVAKNVSAKSFIKKFFSVLK